MDKCARDWVVDGGGNLITNSLPMPTGWPAVVLWLSFFALTIRILEETVPLSSEVILQDDWSL